MHVQVEELDDLLLSLELLEEHSHYNAAYLTVTMLFVQSPLLKRKAIERHAGRVYDVQSFFVKKNGLLYIMFYKFWFQNVKK